MKPAIATLKPFTTPVANVQAVVASLASVGRINGYQLDTRLQAFVFQKLTQLIERPTIGSPTLGLVSGLLVGSIADARQIFDGDSRISFHRPSDNCCTNCMVLPGLKSTFFAGQPFQEAFSSLRAFPLRRRPSPGEPISNIFGLFTAPLFPFRSHRDISASKINANHLAGFLGGWRDVFDLNVDVVLPVPVLTELSGSWLGASQLTNLVIADLQAKPFTPIYCGQTNCPVLLPKRKDSGVIVDAGGLKGFDLPLFLLSSLAVSPNPGASPNSQIGRQAKTTTQLMINLRLNSRLAGYFGLNRLIGVVATIRKRLKRRLKFRALFRRRLELADYSQDLFHGRKFVTCEYSTA